MKFEMCLWMWFVQLAVGKKGWAELDTAEQEHNDPDKHCKWKRVILLMMFFYTTSVSGALTFFSRSRAR